MKQTILKTLLIAKDMIVFLLSLIAIAICLFLMFPRTTMSLVDYVRGYYYDMRYGTIEDAKQEYEATFAQFVELYKILDETINITNETLKKYKLRNEAIKQADKNVEKAMEEYNEIEKQAKEAIEFSQGEIYATKEEIWNYTYQLNEIIQAQENLITRLQEMI